MPSMLCFVIMPFGDAAIDLEGKRKLDHIYNEWIKPTVESTVLPGKKSACFTCHRADKEVRPGDIITHVIESLAAADVVIADLTGQNANVFYELGVRHAIRNNTILLAQDITDIPFDLRGQRAIPYKYDPEQLRKLERELKAALTKIVTNTETIDNPIRRFLCDQAMQDLVRQAAPPGYDSTRTILNEMENLKREFRAHQNQVLKVMHLVTSLPKNSETPLVSENRILTGFQGIWKSSSGSACCARIVNGQLYIPYSYHDDGHLTGHYYQCTVVNDSMFGRFKWFDSHISGYAYFKVVNANKITGGWWYSEDVPMEIRGDILRIDDSLPDMNEFTWTRNKHRKDFPKWAEKYFDNQEYIIDPTR